MITKNAKKKMSFGGTSGLGREHRDLALGEEIVSDILKFAIQCQ